MRILRNLDRGVLILNRRRLVVGGEEKHPWSPLRQQTMYHNHRYSTDSESLRFPRYTYSIQAGTAENLLSEAGVAPSDLRLGSWSDLNYWLGAELVQSGGNSTITLALDFPVYAALVDPPTLRGPTAIVQGEAHGRMQGSLSAQAAIRRNDKLITFRTLYVPPSENADATNRFDLTLPLPSAPLSPNDQIQFRLYHDKLGELSNPATIYVGYVQPDAPDLVARVVSLFAAGQRLTNDLTNPQGPRSQGLAPFEAATMWLMCVICDRCIPLFVRPEGETLREGKQDQGSADVILYNYQQETGIVLLDCTVAVPSTDKAERLRNTAFSVSERLAIPIGAAIASPRDLPIAQREWAEMGVAILDRDRLRILGDLVVAGNRIAARNQFIKWLQDVPAIQRV